MTLDTSKVDVGKLENTVQVTPRQDIDAIDDIGLGVLAARQKTVTCQQMVIIRLTNWTKDGPGIAVQFRTTST